MHTEILSLSAIQKPEPRPTSEMLDLYRLQADRDLEDTLLRISPRMGRAMRLSDSTRVMTRAIIDEIPVQFMYPRGGAGDLVERTAFLASIYLKHLSTTSYTLP